ncbi:MAG TPA: bluetail domain-containing putative surface protein, partial [Rhizomicrobium sp.]|nr:bluetail domain-containing putative surface protein [Rhizomicrobium sp.]
GDYTGAHALVLTDSTVANVEEFDFEPGHSYNITLGPHTVASNETLKVDASLLGAADALTFDGSKLQPVGLTNTNDLHFVGGAGNDTLVGCYGYNFYDLTHGGEDTASGTAFDSYNYFTMGAAFDAGDRLTGSSAVSSNYVDLNGDYTGANAVTLNNGTLSGIGQMNFEPGHNYDITWADGDLAAHGTFNVNAQPLQASNQARFDGSAETNGHFVFLSGEGSDDFTGGSQSDTFRYDDGIALSAATHDIINAFDFANDIVEFAADVTGIAAALDVGSVNKATIDSDLTNILTAARLPAHDALLYTAKTGNLAGHVFLIVDGNGVAGYQTGSDLVIELSGALHTGSISTANFSR